MKKLFFRGSAAALLALGSIGSGVASAASQQIAGTNGIEGCVIVGTAGPGGGTCSYTPTSPGMLLGGLNISVILYRLEPVQQPDGTFKQQQVRVATLDESSQVGCAQWSPTASGGKYNNIDLVVGQVNDGTSAVVFGDPVLTQGESPVWGTLTCN